MTFSCTLEATVRICLMGALEIFIPYLANTPSLFIFTPVLREVWPPNVKKLPSVRSLRFDDLLHIFRSDGKKVDFVGEPFAGKDSINVGADKYSGDVLLLERFEGASPGVVKFSGLAYRQTRQNQEPKFGHRIV